MNDIDLDNMSTDELEKLIEMALVIISERDPDYGDFLADNTDLDYRDIRG